MANALLEFSNALADAVELSGASTVGILEGGRQGVSGTVWRDGIVVTAEHTIRSRDEVSVVLPTGEIKKGKVAGRDPGRDLAIVRLENGAAKPAELADTRDARVGHVVLAIGRRGSSGLSASYGVVSAIGGPWRTWQGEHVDRHWRLDVSPYPGFSGGALIDVQGRVLGINTSGPRGAILTIPGDTVSKVVGQLLEKGRIARGYLGAGLQSVQLPSSIERTTGRRQEVGLLVVMVAPGGPAESAGLLIGDVLLSVDGQVVSGTADLQSALDGEKIGKTARLKVLRGGNLADVDVVIGERLWRE
jgi:S1-C subfamily serine protease